MIVTGLSLETLATLVGLVCVLRAFRLFLDFRRVLASIHHLPGYRTIISASSMLGHLFPPIPLFNLGHDHFWLSKHAPFAERGLDIISIATCWPKATGTLLIADVNVIKDIVWSRGGRFPKPLELYTVLAFFGKNIIASEGSEWKRYRKIVAPAFSERNNRLVWDATTQIMLDLFDTVWAGQQEVVVDHSVDLTLPIALFVIGAAGFGRPISWKEDAVVPLGHQLTFNDAIHTVSQNLILPLLVPRWVMGLTKHFRRTRLAFDELHRYLTEMIHERQGSQQEHNHDLFSSLLSANDNNESSKDDVKLSDSELISNIFIFLVAGHETTAHTLSFAFALLALHPDKQEEMYQHIKRVLPDGRIPTYDDMPSLTYSSAVFNETMRMFPSASVVPKLSTEDTTFTLTDANGTMKTVVVPKGVELELDITGVHYNPKYWEDPFVFKPERFLGDWNRDAFLPFSAGSRGCVGKKFAETEAAAVLTILISRYTISIKDEPQFAGETYEQRKARVLDARSKITLTPTRLPLVYRRRT
ncbi:cytochrome P450 [Suillus fuscotomentosus]|uniref:Cytochrome P450 n=1 Tax=Suillus fuscotomentosus TaxID=1912939 RepID=A0AAD4HMU5_9AGAM|nr:cytochrome P450 [Suillus fuscotomentosus]KAG1902247.1 cytochrome P450 [Suillus fuscotomentosus]